MNWTLVIQIAIAAIAVIAVAGIAGGIVYLIREDSKSYPHTPGN